MKNEFVLIATTKGIEGHWPETIEFIKKQNPCWFPWTFDINEEKMKLILDQINSKGIDFYVHFSRGRGNSGNVEYICRVISLSHDKPYEENLISYGKSGFDDNGKKFKIWFKIDNIPKKLMPPLNWENDFLDYRGIKIDKGQLRGSIILAKRKKRESVYDL